MPHISSWGDVATDKKTALLIVTAIVALSLVAASIHFYDKSHLSKASLLKKNASSKNKCPPPKPSITIEPYRIPLPAMKAVPGKKSNGPFRALSS
jgi:hypothetical protein